MITVEQLRASRHALRWTFEDLAHASGVSVRTLKSLEMSSGELSCRESTATRIIDALEAAGIEFIGTPNDAPGIRIHKHP